MSNWKLLSLSSSLTTEYSVRVKADCDSSMTMIHDMWHWGKKKKEIERSSNVPCHAKQTDMIKRL